MIIHYLSSSELPSRTANSMHVMQMCRALARNGHRVNLYAKRGDPALGDVFAYYSVDRCFDIVGCRRPPFRKLMGDLVMAREVARRAALLPRPDLFFARQIYSLAAVARLGVPMVFEAHTPPVNILQKQVEGWVFRQANFQRLVLVSEALRRQYQRLFPGLPGSRMQVAHDAAEPFPADPPPPPDTAVWPGRPDRFQVGYVGHLYQGRGIGLITRLARRLPDMDFHFVGGMDRDLQRWKSVCAEPNVWFHGFVTPSRLPSYYARFDLVVAPYQQRVLGVGGKKETSRWMSPLKVFESMAAGRALVCSDHPVLHEVLTHGVNSWLVPPSDVDAWHRALETLRDRQDLREQIAKNACADFQAHYTWRARAEKVLAQ